MHRLGSGLLAALAICRSVTALRVASGSPCEVKCGNTLDHTGSSDMTCSESAYATTSNGVVFQNCVECELTSPYAFRKQTDLQWMLYNLRYAISYCLFGFPDNENVGSSPCITSTACGPLERAFEFNSLAPNVSAYEYCAFWNQAQVPKCSACLVAGSNHYLNNFLTILNAACQQQPASGSILAVSGSPFSTTPVTITDPSPIPTAALRPEDSGPLNLGAKVGIAVGGLLVLLGTAGCCIVWNGRRRRRRFLRRLHEKATAPAAGSGPRYGGGAGDAEGAGSWPSPQNHGETPMSQRPLRGWDDSPTERNRPSSRYFSPYSSQYNSPVSAVEASGMFAWPTEKLIASTTTSPVQQQQQSPQELHQHQNGLGIGIAIGGADASREDVTATGYPADVKGKDRDGAPEGEAYEMQRVEPSTVVPMPAEPQAPVLHHPGYGRHYQGRPETDLRAGQAV